MFMGELDTVKGFTIARKTVPERSHRGWAYSEMEKYRFYWELKLSVEVLILELYL